MVARTEPQPPAGAIRRRKLRSALAPAVILGGIHSAAFAQANNEDVQVWTLASVKAPVSDRLDVSADLYVGLIDDASKPNHFLTRAILSYKLDHRFSIGTGYTFVSYHNAPITTYVEHRITQELAFKSTLRKDHPLLTLRPRVEERFREGESGTSVRVRHLTRVDLPISARGLKLIGWNETFYVANSTSWARGHRFDAMINFIGIGVPLSKHVTLEPGYLNLSIFRAGQRDQVARVLGFFISAEF